LLQESGISEIAFDAEQSTMARLACRQYGKGRHKTALNFGDCAAYALSKTSGEPLLYKGNDFAHTDIVSALDGTT
jgi:ribonuclease VapC